MKKMEQLSTTKYVQISNRIFVPKEWPVRGIETFLLELAETVIRSVTSDELIILQVHNIPTILVLREKNSETQYFFVRIFRPELIDAYIIDVVFNKNDKNLSSELNSADSEDLSERSADNIHYSHKEISLDDYVIMMNQSENRKTYYFIPAENDVQTLSPEPIIGRGMHQYSASRVEGRAIISYDILLLLAAIGISCLCYLIVIGKIESI